VSGPPFEFDSIRLAVTADGGCTGAFLVGLGRGMGARGNLVGMTPELFASVCNFVAMAAKAGRIELCELSALEDGFEFPDDFGGFH